MKNNLRVVSLVMLISLIFSGSLLYYMIADIIVPSWTQEGVDLYVYVIVCVILISIVLKFITGMFGLTAFTKSTTEEEKQKKLKIGGKLSVPIAACGLLCLFIKLFYSDTFLVADVFDIGLDILLGFMFIICSMFVRAGRE
ncbi:hypothetical protein [uncultured Ruminococcus sp.]|jgi:hypothetical protein|uniref:hypothetical protein n=1 Tax=uncultured Ruminococcus sp. TaxID=165186 RepID=UPI0025D892E8|nr:hypothetical protein [uncultured Ruminococcus sp.]